MNVVSFFIKCKKISNAQNVQAYWKKMHFTGWTFEADKLWACVSVSFLS